MKTFEQMTEAEIVADALKAVPDLRDALGRLGSGTALSQKKK